MSLVLQVDILGEYKNLTAATKGAQTQLGQLNKRTAAISNGMNKAFAAIGVGFSLNLIKNELEDAAKAAVEDQKSQALLAKQLENTTGATKAQVAQVEKQIAKLQLTASIADDELRPSFALLTRTTGNTTDAMRLLTLATNVSAGSGKSLQSVTMALSKAYQGKMTALSKLGVPMMESMQNASDYAKELNKLNQISREVSMTTGKDHTEALEKLEKQQDKVNRIVAEGIDWEKDLADAFKGAADTAANIDPYQRMQIIFGEMQEQVGTALLPILEKFSKWLATPEGQKKLQEIVDLIKLIITEFSKAVAWVLDNKDWLVPMVLAVGGLKSAWEGVTGAITATKVAMEALPLVGALIGGGAAAGGVATGVGAGAAAGGYLTEQVRAEERTVLRDALGIGPKTPTVTPKKTTPSAAVKSGNVTVNIKGTQSAQQIAQTLNKQLKASGSSTVIRGGR